MFQLHVDTRDVERFVKSSLEFVQHRVPVIGAGVVTEQIKRLTSQGKDSRGGSFPEYTKPYQAKRRKAGKQVSPANLRCSGNYMDSFQGRMENGVYVVGPSKKYEKRMEGLERKFHHMGVHPDTPRIVAQLASERFNVEVK